MAEYCDTPQSKERGNREYKVCLSRGTILHLLDGFSLLFTGTRSLKFQRLQLKEDFDIMTGLKGGKMFVKALNRKCQVR